MREVDVTLQSFDTQLGIIYSKHASNVYKKDYWVVKKTFRYYVDGDFNRWVEVPKGFLTDGASVPRFFWGLIPPWGKYGQAAVLHDWLCEEMGYWNYGRWEALTRREVDHLFNAAMKELEVPKLTRNAMFNAVRVYSAFADVDGPKNFVQKRTLEKTILSTYQQTKTWI